MIQLQNKILMHAQLETFFTVFDIRIVFEDKTTSKTDNIFQSNNYTFTFVIQFLPFDDFIRD